ncbi:MAG: hypothetical protein ABJB47_16035, partial [Actinomycetota bacterium]
MSDTSDSIAAEILRMTEPEIGRDLGRQLRRLLQQCFPGYPGRSYFKLPPHFRYLVAAARALDVR